MTEQQSNTVPLASKTPSSLDSISQLAGNVFSKENMAAARSAAKEQALELRQQAQEGHVSIKMLGVIGGILLMVIASLEFVRNLLSLHPVNALIELYTFLLGAIVIVLEGKKMFFTASVNERLHKYALFLKFLWGRGILYFIAGTLIISQMGVLNFIAGGYMCLLGVMYIVVGHQTASKLRSLRSAMISEQTLRAKFYAADVDGDGGLNKAQFQQLTQSIGMDMTRRETEAAFYHIHKQDNAKLSYQEFHAWWMETDAEVTMEDNVFSLL
jgi:hypothetical protein